VYQRNEADVKTDPAMPKVARETAGIPPKSERRNTFK